MMGLLFLVAHEAPGNAKFTFLQNGTARCGNINEISSCGDIILVARHHEAPGNAKIVFLATWNLVVRQY